MKKCIICLDASPIRWHGKKCGKCWDQQNKYRHQTPKSRFTQAKRDSNKRNIEWSLNFKEYSLLISNPCIYCNDKMNNKVLFGSGLDRLDNNVGYHLYNVVPCCKTCNIIKHDFLSFKETVYVVKEIILYNETGTHSSTIDIHSLNIKTPIIKLPNSKNRAHKPLNRFNRSKHRAFKDNRLWDISYDDFEKIIDSPCYYCNNILGPKLENQGSGLDRINCNLGYTISNVLACCSICNTIRNRYLSVMETKIAVVAIINIKLNKDNL